MICYLTQDDAEQCEAAKNLIENGEPVFISHIVFVEAVRVLATSYGLDRSTITKALDEVTNSGFFILEKENIVSKALQDYRNGYDFADMLIGYYGKASACNTAYTFDKQASKHLVFTLLLQNQV